jgi:hypothetical protein
MRDLNLIDYEISKHIAMRDIPFAALIAAALRKADSDNFARLESVFPGIASDLKLRYNAPGGILLKDNIENYDETLKRVKEIANSYLESF